jgi:hypothetical protein
MLFIYCYLHKIKHKYLNINIYTNLSKGNLTGVCKKNKENNYILAYNSYIYYYYISLDKCYLYERNKVVSKQPAYR